VRAVRIELGDDAREPDDLRARADDGHHLKHSRPRGSARGS
jgi:hypothetical protein